MTQIARTLYSIRSAASKAPLTEHSKAYFAVGRFAVAYIDAAGARHTVVFVQAVYRDRWFVAQYGPNWRKQSNRNARLAKRQEVLRWN